MPAASLASAVVEDVSQVTPVKGLARIVRVHDVPPFVVFQISMLTWPSCFWAARIARGREQGRAVRQDLEAVRVPVAPGVGVELDGRRERGPAVVGGGDPHVGGRLVRDVDVGAARAHADPRLVSPRLAGHLDRRAPRGRVVRRLAEHHVVAVHERGVERAVGRHLEDRVVLPLHALALTEVGLGAPADAVVARDAHVHRDARALLAGLRAAEPVVHRVDVRSARIGGDRRLPRVLDAELDLAGPSGRGHGRRHRASFRSGDGTLPRPRHRRPRRAPRPQLPGPPPRPRPRRPSRSPRPPPRPLPVSVPMTRAVGKPPRPPPAHATTTINDATQPLRIPHPLRRMTREPYAWAWSRSNRGCDQGLHASR